jgi:hypothetical protein
MAGFCNRSCIVISIADKLDKRLILLASRQQANSYLILLLTIIDSNFEPAGFFLLYKNQSLRLA